MIQRYKRFGISTVIAILSIGVSAEERSTSCNVMKASGAGARSSCIVAGRANATSATTQIDFQGRKYVIKESDDGITLNGTPAMKMGIAYSQDSTGQCYVLKSDKTGICYKK